MANVHGWDSGKGAGGGVEKSTEPIVLNIWESLKC